MKIGVKVFVAALVLGGGVWGTAVAEQTGETEEKVTMGEVVVTASRQEEPTAKVPARVTVIDAEEIERSNAQNVPELLAEAGAFVTDTGGYKRSYKVDLRGFGETSPANTLVLVDGRRINQADLSGTDWTLIPLDRIDRIEVVPGPRGSVLYGDNATGGVINIITKKEGAGLEGRGSLQLGSYSTVKGTAGISGASGLVSYDLSAGYLDSEGYRRNGDTRAKDAGASVRLDPTEFLSMNFSGGYHEDKTGLPGSLLKSDLDSGVYTPRDTTSPDSYAETEDYYGKMGVELFFLTDDSFRIDGSYRSRSFDTYYPPTFEGTSDLDTFTVSPSFVFQERFGSVSNRIVMGVDFVKAEEEVKDSSGQKSELEKENIGYYIHDDLGVTENLTLSGGYRRDKAEFDLSISDIFGLPIGDEAETKLDEEAYSIGISYAVGRAKAYVTYGQSYRYPLLDEYFNYNTFSFDEDLKAQTSTSWEAGVKFDLTGSLSVNANLFSIETSDELFYNPVTWENINLDGDTERNGFEFGAAFRQGGVVGQCHLYLYPCNNRRRHLRRRHGTRCSQTPGQRQCGLRIRYGYLRRIERDLCRRALPDQRLRQCRKQTGRVRAVQCQDQIRSGRDHALHGHQQHV